MKFDGYTLQARLMPTYIVLLPVAVLTAQIPGLSHRKIRLEPTFHTVSFLYATKSADITCIMGFSQFFLPVRSQQSERRILHSA